MAHTLLQRDPDQAVASVMGQFAWISILRGIVAVLFGLAALFWPGMALKTLMIFFGVYAFADGVFSLLASFRMAEQRDPWIALLLEGIVGISASIITFRAPDLAAVVLVYVVGAWAIMTGGLKIVTAIELRKSLMGEWAVGLSGLFTVILGWLLIGQPLAGILTIVWMIGIYAVLFGGLMISVGFRMRRLSHEALAGAFSKR